MSNTSTIVRYNSGANFEPWALIKSISFITVTTFSNYFSSVTPGSARVVLSYVSLTTSSSMAVNALFSSILRSKQLYWTGKKSNFRWVYPSGVTFRTNRYSHRYGIPPVRRSSVITITSRFITRTTGAHTES